MADESLVSLLKDGVETWNKWRSEGQRGLPDLSGANLCGAKLSLANLRGADLSGAKLSEANLGEADLSGSMLSEAKLWRADLSRANLDGVVLNRANLRESNLSRAGLSKAELIRADLRQADLRQANLGGSNLSGATLRRTLLDGTNFERATVGATIFADIDLSSCRGLESVRHRGKSTLGVDSIARSKGQIPKIFLREVGLPNTDEWISYISSSVSDAIQFYSCFISYSNKDKAFATRLYDALQSKGVICYYDEEQLLPGDDISREIKRGIDLWEKFLLCASKNSLTSQWVEEEIKATLEKERTLRSESGTKVSKLIPLNLDGYMFSEGWDLGAHATEIRSRVAVDFQGWETVSFNFDKQVCRVIKALRADERAREPPPKPRLK